MRIVLFTQPYLRSNIELYKNLKFAMNTIKENAKYVSLAFLLILFSHSNSLLAQTISNTVNPDWTNAADWTGAAPSYIITIDTELAHNSTITNPITIDNGGILTINAGVTLTTDDKIFIKNGGILIINGTLIGTTPGMEFLIDKGTLTVNTGGVLEWAGFWTSKADPSTITIDGYLKVAGNMDNKVTIDGTGNIDVGGTLNNDTGTIFGCGDAGAGCCTGTDCTMQDSPGTVYWVGLGDGSTWNDADNWSPHYVPDTATDDITIDCSCTVIYDINADLIIDGSLTIGAGTTLDLDTEKLDIGKNADTATLTNNGTIQNSSDVKVKGGGFVGAGPFITNTGTINTVKLSVGNNKGGGQLTNTASGIITISGGGDALHIDGTLVNEGTITLTDPTACILVHGGIISGGGTIFADCIKLKTNPELGASGGAADIQDQSFSNIDGTCSGADSSTPLYTVTGGRVYSELPYSCPGPDGGPRCNDTYTYQELLDEFGLTDGDQFVVDADNVSSCGEAPLPVELVYFKGKLLPKGLVLEWQTASELNNDFFEVEVATDGENYLTVAKIIGQGTTTAVTNYDFTDRHPASGLNYYRLRQVDFNGDFEYSNIISVMNDAPAKLFFSAYPQPATSCLTLQLMAIDDTSLMNLVIYNMNGRIIKNISIDPITKQLPLDISAFNNGLYLVRLSQAEQAYHGRLLIQK